MEDMQAHMLSPSSKRGNELEGCSEAKEGLRYGPLMAWNSAEDNFQEVWEKGMQESRWLHREQEWGFPGFQEKTTWRKEKNHVREQVLGEKKWWQKNLVRLKVERGKEYIWCKWEWKRNRIITFSSPNHKEVDSDPCSCWIVTAAAFPLKP